MFTDETKLMKGDCLERMKEIDDNSIDLTVTSPPYDNLRLYKGNNEQWGEHVWKAVIEELYRVTKQGGVVVWVVGDATINGSETGTSFKQALWAMECRFNLHDTMIYYKSWIPFPMHTRYQQMFEYMFVFSKNKPKTFNGIRIKSNAKKISGATGRNPDGSLSEFEYNKTGVGSRYRDNVWKIKRDFNKKTKHPAVFPEQLAHDHIISWSNKGDTVLDPFTGSGTTGVACMNTRRYFIGIELEKEYFTLAKKRIRSAYKNRGLLNFFNP